MRQFYKIPDDYIFFISLIVLFLSFRSICRFCQLLWLLFLLLIYKMWIFCMFVTWSLFFIQSIEFLTIDYIHLFFFKFSFKILQLVCCWMFNWFMTSLLNDNFLVSSSLINSLFTLIFMLLHFVWLFLAGMCLDVFVQNRLLSTLYELPIVSCLVHVLLLYLLKFSYLCFFIFELL